MASLGELTRVIDCDGDRWKGDMAAWPRTLWIDPGVTSGVAVVWWDPASLLCGRLLQECVLAVAAGYIRGPEFKQVDQFIELAATVHGGKKGLTAGGETFRVMTVKMEDDFLSPVRIRSMIAYDFYKRGRPFYGQSPSEAKTAFPDDRLKELGMYVPGPDHARDAVRHGLLWVKRLRGTNRARLTEIVGDRESWWD